MDELKMTLNISAMKRFRNDQIAVMLSILCVFLMCAAARAEGLRVLVMDVRARKVVPTRQTFCSNSNGNYDCEYDDIEKSFAFSQNGVRTKYQANAFAKDAYEFEVLNINSGKIDEDKNTSVKYSTDLIGSHRPIGGDEHRFVASPGRYLVRGIVTIQWQEETLISVAGMSGSTGSLNRELLDGVKEDMGLHVGYWGRDDHGEYEVVDVRPMPLPGNPSLGVSSYPGLVFTKRYSVHAFNEVLTHVDNGEQMDTALLILPTSDKVQFPAGAMRTYVAKGILKKASSTVLDQYVLSPVLSRRLAWGGAAVIVQCLFNQDTLFSADTGVNLLVAGIAKLALPGGAPGIIIGVTLSVAPSLIVGHVEQSVFETFARSDDYDVTCERDNVGQAYRCSVHNDGQRLQELQIVGRAGPLPNGIGGSEVKSVIHPALESESTIVLSCAALPNAKYVLRYVVEPFPGLRVQREDEIEVRPAGSTDQLVVPYYCQEATQWCFFNSAAMILRYYKPELDKKPWEIAAHYGKTADQDFVSGNESLAHYLNSVAPELMAEGGWSWYTSGQLRSSIEENVRAGAPVLLGKSSATNPVTGTKYGLGHATVVVGVCDNGLWLHNPGAVQKIPFDPGGRNGAGNASGVKTFLRWEEVDEIFGLGVCPQYVLYCQKRVTKTGADTIGLGNLTIRFYKVPPSAMPVSLTELAWDGTEPEGYRWDPSLGQTTTIPQDNVEVHVQFGLGNPFFDRRVQYSVGLELKSAGSTAVLAATPAGPLDLAEYVRRTVPNAPVRLPQTSGGTESICLILRDPQGNELDRCEFIFERARIDRKPTETGMLDVVLCIDKSGSMSDDIQVVKRQVDTILDGFDAIATSEKISLRVGLATFSYTGTGNVFELFPLAERSDEIRQFVTRLNARDVGGDEDLYSALMYVMNEPVDGKQIDMGWRAGAAKIAIPITDEPAKTDNFTLDQVRQVAKDLDPVHMYPLLMPKSPLSWLDPAVSSMKELAAKTGGEAVQVESADKLPAAIIAAVKLAIRRHKEEVWRKENPPYLLYGVGAGIGVIVVFGLGVLLVRGTGLEGALQTASPPADPLLTGQISTHAKKTRQQ